MDTDDADAVKDAEKMVQTRLKPWRNALHYGKDQEMMHACAGWFLGRNILQIERDDSRCTGPGMSALNATPCPLRLYPQLITPFACAQWECLCRRSWTRAAARSGTNGT